MDKRLVALGTLGVGFFVSASIILGVVGGRWLDGKLNSEPLFLIIGLILGVVVAFYGVYIMLRPLMKDKQDKENS
jgi:F0F1-type ATP synthase assembly protein I